MSTGPACSLLLADSLWPAAVMEAAASESGVLDQARAAPSHTASRASCVGWQHGHTAPQTRFWRKRKETPLRSRTLHSHFLEFIQATVVRDLLPQQGPSERAVALGARQSKRALYIYSSTTINRTAAFNQGFDHTYL